MRRRRRIPFDGVVDLEDLNRVRNHFGGGAEGVATPEPNSASLAGAGAGLLLFGLIVGHRRYSWAR